MSSRTTRATYLLSRHPDVERGEAASPRFAYIPFGGGPRGCIGNQFAMVEAQLIVAAIAQRYRIEVVPDQDIRPEPLITLRPAPGIRAILNKRPPRDPRSRG